MSSSEIDLGNDGSLAELISAFTETSAERRRREGAAWAPFSLTGFDAAQLRARFVYDPDTDSLIWEVQANVSEDGWKPILLRYAMTARELGDVWSDRGRCEVRLSKFAEAHLRADLHLVCNGYVPVTSARLTRIDRKGWVQDS
jgi:hypothetical protein